ncbi:MAG: hypothetical protein U0575_11905 [Phycisphaerales bacterium]
MRAVETRFVPAPSTFVAAPSRVVAAPSWRRPRLVLIMIVAPDDATGCGGTPPPPMCGKTTTLTKTPPLVFPVAPAGGVVMFPVSVGLGATGPCPPPVTTTIALTVACLPPPGAAGMVTIPTPLVGATPALVPVAIPPGPPRVCTVSGTATTLWADGTTSIGMGDTTFCIVEPSPVDPTVPRLDLQRLSSATQFAHPGDQRTHLYRLVNNDPNVGVSIVLSADSEQVARFPGGSPLPPGSPNGLYSISDPAGGDNFPIAFVDDLCGDPWVPLPPDPPSFGVPTISKPLTIPPGGSRVVAIAQRSWPMCGCGSTCESRVMVTGTYDDGTPAALACSGAGLSADCNVPPDFACPDGGAAGPVVPAGSGLSVHIQMPTHTIEAGILAETIMVGQQQLNVNTTSQQTDAFRSRITAAGAVVGPPLQIGQPVNVICFIQLPPMGGDSSWTLQSLGLHLAAPGFNDNYFLLNAHSKVLAPGIPPTIDSFFDVFQTVSLDGISGGLSRKGRILPGSIVIQPVDATSYSLGFTGIFDPQPGLPNQIQQVNLRIVAEGIGTGIPVEPGACATANHDCATIGGPGCTDACCCNVVCAVESFCCAVQWDQSCVKEAFEACALAPPPANDECSHATIVNDGVTSFSTIGATTSGPPLPPSCEEGHGPGLVDDVWYRYVSSGTGPVHVSTCDSDYDTRIAVYVDCPNGPSDAPLACNDDSCGLQSSLFFGAVCGGTYVIRVGGFNGSGNGNLAIENLGECPSACITDLNGDGTTDGADLGIELAGWGGAGPTDLNGDGTTDGADLGIMLAAWGPCAGPTFTPEWDADNNKLTYKLTGGTPARKYTVAGGTDAGNILIVGALQDLTADANGKASGTNEIKCKECNATGGKVTVKLIQDGLVFHMFEVCFKCKNLAVPPEQFWVPDKIDCP